MEKKNFDNLDKVNLSFIGKEFSIDGNVTVCKVKSVLRVRLGCSIIKEIEYNTIGVAKCNPDDQYDEKKGKLISSARAENEAYVRAMRSLKSLARDMINVAAGCDSRHSLMWDYKYHNKVFINNVINNTDDEIF